MLLLPLLILWARRPMQFNDKLLKMLTGAIVFAAVLLPLCTTRSLDAAERDGSSKGAYNSFRNDDQTGRAGNGVAANGEANPMRPKKLREGTLVPPTVGRFVATGRRWMFVPDGESDESPDVVLNELSPRRTPNNVFRSASAGKPAFAVGSLGQRQSPSAQMDLRNRLREPVVTNSFSIERYQLAIKPAAFAMGQEKGNPIGLPQIVAVENLMLQRIVEAIRVDGADDRWIVSGELTEYFDENRLRLKTAQRAASR